MIGTKSELNRVKRRHESGQTLIMFALGLAVLLVMAALTIDVGLAYVARRDMQNAADAAALAGADVLLEGQSSVLATNAARDLALQNGYDNAAADVTVTISIPPTSGPHSGDSDFIEVLIEHPIDAVMARAVGKTSFDISARAVAAFGAGVGCCRGAGGDDAAPDKRRSVRLFVYARAIVSSCLRTQDRGAAREARQARSRSSHCGVA